MNAASRRGMSHVQRRLRAACLSRPHGRRLATTTTTSSTPDKDDEVERENLFLERRAARDAAFQAVREDRMRNLLGTTLFAPTSSSLGRRPQSSVATRRDSLDGASPDDKESGKGWTSYFLGESFGRRTSGGLEEPRRRMRKLREEMQDQVSSLGSMLNKTTGYNIIEELKNKVETKENDLQQCREEAKTAKMQYELSLTRRSQAQRETNELLGRKADWESRDVLRFTELVKGDHQAGREETLAKERYGQAEARVERAFEELMRSLLARYHEEQVWSDKIRAASTWGSWALMALNLVVFVSAVTMVEPWKRQKLANQFSSLLIDQLDELHRQEDETNALLARILQNQENQADSTRPTESQAQEEQSMTERSIEAATTPQSEPSLEKYIQERPRTSLSAAALAGAITSAFCLWLLR